MTLLEEVTTQVGMSLEVFLDAQEDQPFEILEGERVDRMPNVFGHTWYIRLLFLTLYQYATQHDLGEVFTESTYAQIVDGAWVKGSRIPDIVFYSRERIETFKAENPDWRKRPLHIAPDLTIEVIPPTERAIHVTQKIRVDMANGVRMVWAVDIENEVVTVYEGENGRILAGDSVLEGKDVLPDFRLPLAELFKKV